MPNRLRVQNNDIPEKMNMETNRNVTVDVMGIGDAMVDLLTHAATLPPRGGNIWSSAVSLSPGGTTANVAANAATLGIRSGFIGCVGDDPYGQYTIQEFQKAGVDTTGVIVRPGDFTGIVLAIIDDTGERTFIACARGASHTDLQKTDIDRIKPLLPAVIHTSGVCLVEEPSRSALLYALEFAHDCSHLIYYDPNLRLEGDYFPPELRAAQLKAIACSDVVLIGDEEMRLLFPHMSFSEGVEHMFETGVRLVVLKQGEQGASVFSDDFDEHCPAFKVPVLSTAGAGDSFDAGFIAARCRGADLHDALVYACAVGALKVTRQGARAVPNHAETMAFLKERDIHLPSLLGE